MPLSALLCLMIDHPDRLGAPSSAVVVIARGRLQRPVMAGERISAVQSTRLI
jgi:hypothetical protein